MAELSRLCGHAAEDYAVAALGLEPRGSIWSKSYETVKAALYRAFGSMLASFELRMCDLFNESLGCGANETIDEWERVYDLPGDCFIGDYPTDLAGRQAQVCAAKRAQGVTTLSQIESILRVALDCDGLELRKHFVYAQFAGVCISGIGPVAPRPVIHNVVGGQGEIAEGYGSAVGQPLVIPDPDYADPTQCPIYTHSTVGGWTGGVGLPLLYGDPAKVRIINCIMTKHLPAHVAWFLCTADDDILWRVTASGQIRAVEAAETYRKVYE